jgi:hypothetical protein
MKPLPAPNPTEIDMNAIHSQCSTSTRFACAFAACVISATLFAAVAVGLCGTASPAAPLQACVQAPASGA